LRGTHNPTNKNAGSKLLGDWAGKEIHSVACGSKIRGRL